MKPQEITLRIVIEGAAVQAAAPSSDDFTEVEDVTKSYTKSQLLRFALRRKYQALKPPVGRPFELWYNEQMDRIIEVVKKG